MGRDDIAAIVAALHDPHVWSARPIQRTNRKFTPSWDLSLTYQQRGH
jgi:hypothetical protein